MSETDNKADFTCQTDRSDESENYSDSGAPAGTSDKTDTSALPEDKKKSAHEKIRKIKLPVLNAAAPKIPKPNPDKKSAHDSGEVNGAEKNDKRGKSETATENAAPEAGNSARSSAENDTERAEKNASGPHHSDNDDRKRPAAPPNAKNAHDAAAHNAEGRSSSESAGITMSEDITVPKIDDIVPSLKSGTDDIKHDLSTPSGKNDGTKGDIAEKNDAGNTGQGGSNPQNGKSGDTDLSGHDGKSGHDGTSDGCSAQNSAPIEKSNFSISDLPTQTNPILSLDDEPLDDDPRPTCPILPVEEAPDLSQNPVIPRAEFERTLIFERNENRWDEAESYTLPKPGDVVGNYRILNMLGKGGFGAVYCAKNMTLGREEALKLILPSAKDECLDIDKRFEREVDIVSRLEHPNIVRLYSSGLLDHNVLWMTMELVRGTRLDSLIAEKGPIPFPRAKRIMLQILSGLMDAHRRQIVHRDLKPANIMLSHKEGCGELVIILDFGLSKALGASEDTSVQDLTLVDSRRIYGTPQYMAPEQLNMGKLGPWTDVYAAGLIFYELLIGRAAVNGDSLFEVAFKQSYEPIIYPPRYTDTVIETIIERACAKNPAQRFKNAGEFFEALQHVEDPSDPPSVLFDERRRSDSDFSTPSGPEDDDEEGEKTCLSIKAVTAPPQQAVQPVRHTEITGVHRSAPAGIIVIRIFAYILALACIVLIFIWLFGLVDIQAVP